MSDKVELVTVKATKEDGRVALYETHPDHPGGEAFVPADGKSYRVARTPTVEQKIRDGELVEVSADRPLGTALRDAFTRETDEQKAAREAQAVAQKQAAADAQTRVPRKG